MPTIGPLNVNFRDAFPTIQNGGTATAPAALTVLASITIPATGLYEVYCCGYYGATLDTTNNFDLFQNATLVDSLVTRNGASTAAVWDPPRILQCTAGDVLTIKNNTIGGAGTVYNAQIIARRCA